MSILDAFTPEDRVNVTFSTLYDLLKEATKVELMMNAVNCNVPHRHIRETMTGKAEVTPEKEEE